MVDCFEAGECWRSVAMAVCSHTNKGMSARVLVGGMFTEMEGHSERVLGGSCPSMLNAVYMN